jgi:hypothetical protein
MKLVRSLVTPLPNSTRICCFTLSLIYTVVKCKVDHENSHISFNGTGSVDKIFIQSCEDSEAASLDDFSDHNYQLD